MVTELRSSHIVDVVELISQPFIDQRGAFLNAFRAQEPTFAQAWGDRAISQINLSRTEAVGAVRGLHLQAPPHSEAVHRNFKRPLESPRELEPGWQLATTALTSRDSARR